jgi:hypothetical protein
MSLGHRSLLAHVSIASVIASRRCRQHSRTRPSSARLGGGKAHANWRHFDNAKFFIRLMWLSDVRLRASLSSAPYTDGSALPI